MASVLMRSTLMKKHIALAVQKITTNKGHIYRQHEIAIYIHASQQDSSTPSFWTNSLTISLVTLKGLHTLHPVL
jgi:hypothetical protein